MKERVGVILARFNPIHNGHLSLIKKALQENDKVLILVGSADKVNSRNPIPVYIRSEYVKKAIDELFYNDDTLHCKSYDIIELDDYSDESDNSHDWGFYLYANIVKHIGQDKFTVYYSDGFEIITSWFPGWIMRNCISMSLMARGGVEDGISATYVRNLIYSNSKHEFEEDEELKKIVPSCIYENRKLIAAFINIHTK